MKVTRSAYEELIQEDIDWLMKQPRTLERDHIILIVKQSPEVEYDIADKIERLERELEIVTTTRDEAIEETKRRSERLKEVQSMVDKLRNDLFDLQRDVVGLREKDSNDW
jgi:chromosome segregation ATPase